MKSIRTYQRKIKELKDLVSSIQWVQPTYNGSPSCSGGGAQQHHGCEKDCPVAKITKNRGETEE